jgi:hypothetical protein
MYPSDVVVNDRQPRTCRQVKDPRTVTVTASPISRIGTSVEDGWWESSRGLRLRNHANECH